MTSEYTQMDMGTPVIPNTPFPVQNQGGATSVYTPNPEGSMTPIVNMSMMSPGSPGYIAGAESARYSPSYNAAAIAGGQTPRYDSTPVPGYGSTPAYTGYNDSGMNAYMQPGNAS